jgi:hypothetical protein
VLANGFFASGAWQSRSFGVFCVYALYPFLDRVLFEGFAAD